MHDPMMTTPLATRAHWPEDGGGGGGHEKATSGNQMDCGFYASKHVQDEVDGVPSALVVHF